MGMVYMKQLPLACFSHYRNQVKTKMQGTQVHTQSNKHKQQNIFEAAKKNVKNTQHIYNSQVMQNKNQNQNILRSVSNHQAGLESCVIRVHVRTYVAIDNKHIRTTCMSEHTHMYTCVYVSCHVCAIRCQTTTYSMGYMNLTVIYTSMYKYV